MRFRYFISLALVSVLLGAAAGSYLAVKKKMPALASLKVHTASQGTRIYADDGTILGELKIEKGIFVPYRKIPRDVINAIVAVEDARFWDHRGLDYIAIIRALVKDLFHQRLKEGGSTITQQLAKVLYLTPEKTFKRKILEAALAIRIERNLSKEEILELYLNRIYFGHGAYGIEMAARTYFGKSVDRLNIAEASLLAGLTKAPTTYSPYNNLQNAKRRQSVVLQRMVTENYITPEQKDQAYIIPLYLSSLRKKEGANGYFLEFIRKSLEEKYGMDLVYGGDLRVHTTLDPLMQAAAHDALQEGLRAIDKRRGWRGPLKHRDDIDVQKEMDTMELSSSVVVSSGDIYPAVVLTVSNGSALLKTRGIMGRLSRQEARWASKVIDPRSGNVRTLKNFSLTEILRPGDVVYVRIKKILNEGAELSLEQLPDVQGALIGMEPGTGFIRSMVGGYDFSLSEFNRALFAERQPGSAFKPIVYAAAMDNGFHPASIVVDEPVTFKGSGGSPWSPVNYDHTYHGPTRLREALAYSRNVVTVKLADQIGIRRIVDFARVLGFRGEIPRDLSIALGSFTTTPLELTTVYNVLAGSGLRAQPVAIKYIADRNGKILESNKPDPQQVISPETAFLVTSMLEDVVRYGTGRRAGVLGRPVAAKTGTSNDYRDAWFIGYSPALTAGVWVGFDGAESLGPGETGAKAAAPIWIAFMERALGDDRSPFPMPPEIETRQIDPVTGSVTRSSDGIREYFKEHSAPEEQRIKTIWEIQDPIKHAERE